MSDDTNIVTKFNETPTKVIELSPSQGGDVKIFEPAGKSAEGQLEITLARIEELKKQGASPDSYAQAFSSDTDVYHVQTGRAEVTEADSLRNLFSTAPEIRDDGPCIPCLLGWLLIGYLAFKFYKRSK